MSPGRRWGTKLLGENGTGKPGCQPGKALPTEKLPVKQNSSRKGEGKLPHPPTMEYPTWEEASPSPCWEGSAHCQASLPAVRGASLSSPEHKNTTPVQQCCFLCLGEEWKRLNKQSQNPGTRTSLLPAPASHMSPPVLSVSCLEVCKSVQVGKSCQAYQQQVNLLKP